MIENLFWLGNDIEIEYALKLLYQLSFDERISTEILDDEKLLENLKNLKDNTNSSINVQKQCEGILWLLKKKKTNNKATPEKLSTIKQIMISYNRESRDIILKIKNELDKLNLGFKIWIDVEDIHGSRYYVNFKLNVYDGCY